MPFEEQEHQNADAAGIEVEIPEDGRKPKSMPCRYCQKRFRRLEHAQFVAHSSLQFFMVELLAAGNLRGGNLPWILRK